MSDSSGKEFETFLLIVIIILAGLSFVLWICAWLAVELFGHGAIHPNLIAPLSALLAHRGDPALAWPATERADIPSWGAYWGTTVLVVVVLSAVVSLVIHIWTKRHKGGEAKPHVVDYQSIRKDILGAHSWRAVQHSGQRLRGEDVSSQRGLFVHRPKMNEYGILLGYAPEYKMDIFANFEDSFLVLGPPRSGKSTSLIIPMLLDAPGPVVTTSTRADVLKETIETVQRQGRPVYVFDPQNLTRGTYPTLRWDPIAGCEDTEIATRRTSALVAGIKMGEDNQFWVQQANSFIRCLLYAAALDKQSISSVLGWVQHPGEQTPISILSSYPNVSQEWLESLIAIQKQPGNTVGSTYAVSQRAFDAFYNESVRASCQPLPGEGFNPSQFLQEKGVLYVLGTPTATTPIAPLLACLIQEIVEVAHEQAVMMHNNRINPPLELLLDEAANIAPLPNLPQLMATGGGSGIIPVVVLQSMSQAINRWGKAEAETMRDSSTIRIVLPGISDISTLEELSSLSGEVEVQQTSDTKGPGGVTTSTLTQSKRRYTPDAIRSLAKHHALVLPQRTPPFVVKLIPYWERVGDT